MLNQKAINRDIHQTVPDHRVKLTPDGWKQAEEAGVKLRSLLHPTDTLHFFTNPYRRTRETTEGILNALTSSTPSPTPFPRHTIKVYEEPRLREQDFGNFQPSSTEMSRMWQERADYGHFFYRIPNGESAADAYDRVSGFNESLWRSFGEDDFASVCVLVTHGLMTRVFLMKWYHFSVEYFEDLRNVNHCEFVVMRLNAESGKYVLQNQLRTWSDLKRERANSSRAEAEPGSPLVPVRKRWGGCQDGESGDDFARRQRARRQNTADLFGAEEGDLAEALKGALEEKMISRQQDGGTNHTHIVSQSSGRNTKSKGDPSASKAKNEPPSQPDVATSGIRIGPPKAPKQSILPSANLDSADLGSGSDDSDADIKKRLRSLPTRSSLAMALNGELDGDGGVGLGIGGNGRVRADALGDQSGGEDEQEEEKERSFEEAVL